MTYVQINCLYCLGRTDGIKTNTLVVERDVPIETHGWGWVLGPSGEDVPICPECKRGRELPHSHQGIEKSGEKVPKD